MQNEKKTEADNFGKSVSEFSSYLHSTQINAEGQI
jgi:hypothetical protein